MVGKKKKTIFSNYLLKNVAKFIHQLERGGGDIMKFFSYLREYCQRVTEKYPQFSPVNHKAKQQNLPNRRNMHSQLRLKNKNKKKHEINGLNLREGGKKTSIFSSL